MGVNFQRGETHLYLGLYEVELNRHLRGIAQPGVKSFDVGGQYGYDALFLAKLTGARVLSVESDSELANEISENTAANSDLPRIDVANRFVSDRNGGEHVTLDKLAEQYFTPDLIKMDIEGGEVAALKGGCGILRDRGPAMQLEVHGREIEWQCLQLMREYGYAPPTVVDRRRWLPEHRPLDHNRWLIFEPR
jgi:hypothetical protein